MASDNFFDLTGKVAVVTGGGRGIGRAISLALADFGAKVLVCGRTAKTLESAVEKIQADGGNAVAQQVDVSEESGIMVVRDRALSEFGRIDILINNAGIDPHYASMEKTSVTEWDEIININLTGVFRCCRILGEPMREQKSGSIINISSIGGHIGLKRQVPYCASKGGVEQLTRALAHDWAEHGVRVNTIAYGFVKTDLTAGVTSHEYIGPQLLARIPLGRFGNTSEVAGAAVFLASPAASYVTGHSLLVDGGWTAT